MGQPGALPRRPTLDGDATYDVAIVGGGFTGRDSTWSHGCSPGCGRPSWSCCPSSSTPGSRTPGAVRWEPEPLRWLGVNAGLRAMTLADVEERATGTESVAARLVRPLVS